MASASSGSSFLSKYTSSEIGKAENNFAASRVQDEPSEVGLAAVAETEAETVPVPDHYAARDNHQEGAKSVASEPPNLPVLANLALSAVHCATRKSHPARNAHIFTSRINLDDDVYSAALSLPRGFPVSKELMMEKFMKKADRIASKSTNLDASARLDISKEKLKSIAWMEAAVQTPQQYQGRCTAPLSQLPMKNHSC